MSHPYDPVEAARMREKYSGLDLQLEYEAGHTIYNRYHDYKDANRAASRANSTYSSTAKPLQQKQPYDADDPVTGWVNSKGYTQSGHRTLEPLAARARDLQIAHVDKRDRFNHDYRDLLTVKDEYEGHVNQTNNSRANIANWEYRYDAHRQGGSQYSASQPSGSQYGSGQYGGSQYGGSQYGGGPSSRGRHGGSQYGGSHYGGSQYGGGPSSGGHYGGSQYGGSQYGGGPSSGGSSSGGHYGSGRHGSGRHGGSHRR